ncbi:S1 RNA-binding domain-containing protein 1 isoform X2 [Leptidea sinapis]|uniref:S1 RNA-binding domain-containing protein 1 isoform X2 n=1 Tax=Leptidea sinapis TaxID=189913 RepID=UPI0021C49B84|nr:S1 RNA-binding domain-containing protein 1 isoform X2 [Leptidea sinapis]
MEKPTTRKRKANTALEDNNSPKHKTVKTVEKLEKSRKINVKEPKKPKVQVKKKVESDDESVELENGNESHLWNEADMLSSIEGVPHDFALRFISLLADGCTLPFIARYRKEAVNHLLPDRLQEIFDSYQSIAQFKKKVKSVLEALRKSKKLTQAIENSILNAKNLSELDLVYAPLKSNSLSLAERARNLGLEPVAIGALNGEYIDLQSLTVGNEELCDVEKVESHITHIVADIIYKDTRVLEQMRNLKMETRFTLQSTRTKSSTKEVKTDENKKVDTKSDPETYKLYFEWKCPVQHIKSYQTLAINRGEDEKILSVKVLIPDWYYNKLERFCLTLWKSSHWVRKGLGDAYNRLIKPWLSRQVRSDLTTAAQKEAIKTFTSNLEKYLLTEPIKNRRICGLDPGFKAGCKVGIIDVNGSKLEACTIYPNLRNNKFDTAAGQLKELLKKHRINWSGEWDGVS